MIRRAPLLLLLALFGCNRGHDFTKAAPALGLSATALSFACTEGGANPPDQTVTLTNTGSANSTLNWTATSNQPWLTVLPASGSQGATGSTLLTFSVNASFQLQAWESATSTASAPSARWVHGAAMSGTEMIVWGGSIAVAPSDVNTGGRFDPSTNTWIGATDVIGAPTARRYPSAISTGTEVIFWGGTNSVSLNTGNRYVPDTWTGATTTTSAASPREAHTAVWTGSQMIIYGGWDGTLLNTGARYNAASNTWAGATSITGAVARQEHAAVWNGTRMIVWGGRNGVDASFSLNTGELYDPVSNSWTGSLPLPGAPSARTAPSAVWTGREMLVWGGHDGVSRLDTGGRYDPVTDTWLAALPTAGAPSARYRHSAVWTGSRMVVWGGEDAVGLTNTGGIYRPPIPAIGTHTAVITISAPGANSAPQTITVTLTVAP